jgi:hypothetical protein
MLLGWLGVSLANAASASADPGRGHQPAPTLGAVLASVTGHRAARPSHDLPIVAPVARTVLRTVSSVHIDAPAAGVHLSLGRAVHHVVQHTPVVGSLVGPAVEQADQPAAQPAPSSGDPTPSDPMLLLTVPLPILGSVHLGVADPLTLLTQSLGGPVECDCPALSFQTPGAGASVGLVGAHHIAASAPARAPAVRLGASPAPSSVPRSLPAPRSSRATAGNAVGRGLPAPGRAPLPGLPDIAMASASGTAATSNPRSGTGVADARTSEAWSALHLHLVGTVRSAEAEAIRNSASEPPVSPD